MNNNQNITTLDNVAAQNMWRKIYSYECGYYAEWVNSCKSNREFYYGEQSTTEEKEDIKARGQYEIVINKIRKSMRGIVGMVAAALPQYKLVPIADNDYYTSTIGEKIIKWAWANSKGINLMRLFVKNAAVDNISYFYVYVDRGNIIKFKTLAFNEVIPDPSCTDPLFRDAEMLMVRRDVSKEYVRDFYGLNDKLVESIQFEVSAHNNPGGVDRAATVSFGDFLERIYSPDKQFVRIYEVYRKKYSRLDNGDIKTRIVQETVLGYNHVFVQELDERITEFPIIPGYVDKAENPYARGEVHFLKDLQRFINKTYGVALLNAQLLSNPKIFITETDLPNNNLKELQEGFAIPGRINVLAAGALPPTVIQGQPLNQAFFTMYQDAKMEMEWNTIPSQALGLVDSEKTPFNSSAMLDMKQTVLDSFKDFMSNIELACTQLGLVVLQYARAYLPEDKIIRIIGEEDLIVNQPQEVDIDDEAQVQQYIQYMKNKGVDEQVVQDELAKMKIDTEKKKSLKYFKNELDFDKYDVTVIPGSYTPTFEMSMLRLMLEMFQTGAMNDPSLIIKYLPVDNRDELISRFDTINQLNAKLEQSESEKEELNSMIQSMTKQLVDYNVKMASMEGKLKIDTEVKMQRVKSYLDKHRSKLQNQEAANKMYKEIEDIVRGVEFEAEKQKLNIRAGNQEGADIDSLLDAAYRED